MNPIHPPRWSNQTPPNPTQLHIPKPSPISPIHIPLNSKATNQPPKIQNKDANLIPTHPLPPTPFDDDTRICNARRNPCNPHRPLYPVPLSRLGSATGPALASPHRHVSQGPVLCQLRVVPVVSRRALPLGNLPTRVLSPSRPRVSCPPSPVLAFREGRGSPALLHRERHAKTSSPLLMPDAHLGRLSPLSPTLTATNVPIMTFQASLRELLLLNRQAPLLPPLFPFRGDVVQLTTCSVLTFVSPCSCSPPNTTRAGPKKEACSPSSEAIYIHPSPFNIPRPVPPLARPRLFLFVLCSPLFAWCKSPFCLFTFTKALEASTYINTPLLYN